MCALDTCMTLGEYVFGEMDNLSRSSQIVQSIKFHVLQDIGIFVQWLHLFIQQDNVDHEFMSIHVVHGMCSRSTKSSNNCYFTFTNEKAMIGERS